MFYIQPQSSKGTHVNVRYPDQGKAAYQVSPPVRIKKMKVGDEQKEDCHVMTEAVFTGEQVEEFSQDKLVAIFTIAGAPLARFSENFFMGHRPCNAGNRDGQQQQ
jgi:hypothetical protein